MKQKIQNLIGNGNAAEALALLLQYNPEAIQLQNRLSNLQRENRLGLLDYDTYSRNHNKITHDIISMAGETVFERKTITESQPQPVNIEANKKSIFFSYAHEDKALQQRLMVFLKPLIRSGKISAWSDEEIKPGDEWDAAIKSRLHTADIILLLVSADFLASDYIWEVELETALQRHKAGTAVVVPIILKPCQWHDSPFGILQALPTGARPISAWPNQDEAFNNVAEGIRRLLV